MKLPFLASVVRMFGLRAEAGAWFTVSGEDGNLVSLGPRERKYFLSMALTEDGALPQFSQMFF